MESAQPIDKWENTYKSDMLFYICMLKINNSIINKETGYSPYITIENTK